jgi:U4/U6 small nuclear ribonucleoprotein PRP4
MEAQPSWSEGSLRRQQEHLQALQRLEAQKIAATLVDVPTLPHLVRDALRQLGQPVRLFGENLANVRDRLKWELAIRKQQRQQGDDLEDGGGADAVGRRRAADADEEAVTKYTRATGALVEARKQIAEFSLQRAQRRLQVERQQRTAAAQNISIDHEKKKRPFESNNDDEKMGDSSSIPKNHDEMIDGGGGVDRLDQLARKTFRKVRNLALEGSQYCDQRAVSCLRVVRMAGSGSETAVSSSSSSSAASSLVVAGTWTGSIHVMDSSLQKVGSVPQCHDDRIMAMDAFLPGNNSATTLLDGSSSSSLLVATASLDRTAKLFRIGYSCPGSTDNEPTMTENGKAGAEDVVMKDAEASPSTGPSVTRRSAAEATTFASTELLHLRGHAARLSRVAFHPMHKHVATTSYDHTWRLWDIETSDCLLLQDGHARECYGIGFHPDGSLVATTDLGGIAHLWDLRTSKSVAFYRSHAGKVLNSEFHPNGFHFGTAGEDGCVHVWDIRHRTKAQKRHGAAAAQQQQQLLHGQATGTPLVSIPAHCGIVTGLRFDASGEFLCTSSFDGAVKLWNCRSWKLLNRLQGHQGKVTSVDVIRDGRAGGRASNSNSEDSLLRGVVTSGFDKTVKLWA